MPSRGLHLVNQQIIFAKSLFHHISIIYPMSRDILHIYMYMYPTYVQRYPTYIHRYIHTYINRISYIHISLLFQLPPRTFCHQKWKAKLLQVLCSGKRPCPETSQQLGKMGCFKGQFEASTVQIFMGYTRDIMEYVIVHIYIYVHIYMYIYNGHLLDI